MSDPTPAPLRLCAHCDYRLTGLEQGSLCPECGTASRKPELMLNLRRPHMPSVLIFGAFWALLHLGLLGFLPFTLKVIATVRNHNITIPMNVAVFFALAILVVVLGDIVVSYCIWQDIRVWKVPTLRRLYIHSNGLIYRRNQRSKVIPWKRGIKLQIHPSKAGYILILSKWGNVFHSWRLDSENIDPDKLVGILREIFDSPDPIRPTPTVIVVSRTPFLPWTPKPKPIIIAGGHANPPR